MDFFTIQIVFNATTMTNKLQNLRIGQNFCENSGSYLVDESGEQYVSFLLSKYLEYFQVIFFICQKATIEFFFLI